MRFFVLLLFILLKLAVFASVDANFTADKFSGCPPLLVNFTNESSPSTGLSYEWDLGNGNTSSLQNPSAVYNTTGTYYVMLTINNGSQTDTIIKTITVHKLPVVNFHAQEVNVCGNDTVFLFNDVLSDAAITDYAWGFGNGVASSDKEPTYFYNQNGQYDITLVVQDSNGCSANLTKPAYITILPKPVAAFTASPAASCNISEVVSFTNTSTGTGLTYYWVLDDSVTSTIANPTHTYYQEVQSVLLTVTNDIGCRSRVTKSIKVTNVIADFSANKTEACTGEQIRFTNQSNFVSSTVWDFGDSITATVASARTVNHAYANPGTYTVKMIDRFGLCADSMVRIAYITIRQGPSVSFATSAITGDCDNNATISFANTTPGAVQFLWRFGDGTTSTLENPDHSYGSNGNFNVSLAIIDSNGCSVSGTMMVPVNSNKPVPRFRGDVLSCPGGAIHFHNSSSGATSYFWDFGDGDTANTANPTHIYNSIGIYTVTLTAYNSTGCDSTVVKTNYITVDTVFADFTVDKTFSPCPPFVTIFTSTSNNQNVRYKWDFGDGSTDTAANPTHIYFHPGIFTVKLIAITGGGCNDTVTYVDLIEVQGPTGTFSATPTEGCFPLNVAFASTVSSNTETIWCDLGDGTLVSDSLNFSYIYTGVGVYNPKYILVDYVGCTVPFDLPPITTHDAPVLELSDTTICSGEKVNVTLGNDNYLWSPATFLSCSTCSNVEIIATQTTSYLVTSANQYGCQTTGTSTVTVAEITDIVSQAPVSLCNGSSAELYAGDYYRMKWSPAMFLNDTSAIRPQCFPQSSIVYTVTGYNSTGCSVTGDVEVQVIEKLEINTTANQSVCLFDSFQINTTLSATPQSEVSYLWTPSGFGIPSSEASPVIGNLETNTTFTVVVQSGSCVADTAYITILVNALPEMEVSEGIITTPYAEVLLSAASRDNLTYTWFSDDSLGCKECQRTAIYPSRTQFVTVTGTDANGCEVSDSVLVQVLNCDPTDIFLANTFTPNGDGLNDKFILHSRILDQLNYFRIFDQWGRMVFETNNLNEGWDGTVNGEQAPVAVYAYVLTGKCQNGYDVTKSDNITLVR